MSSWFFFHVFQMYPQKSFRRSSFIKWAISSFSPDEAHLVLNTVLRLSTAISPLWELPRAEKSHLTRDSLQPLSGHCRSIKTWHSFAPTAHYSKGPSWLPRGLAEVSLCPLYSQILSSPNPASCLSLTSLDPFSEHSAFNLQPRFSFLDTWPVAFLPYSTLLFFIGLLTLTALSSIHY